MRFKSVRFASSIPTVNLVPMLDVVTVILCFFVLTAMTLTSESDTVNVALPGKEEGEQKSTEASEPPPMLTVQATADGNIVVDGTPYDRAQLIADVPIYLNNNPEAKVTVIPEAEASYEQVIQLLVELRKVGGDRVSLAVGGSRPEEAEEEPTTDTEEPTEVEEIAEPSTD